MEGLAALPTDGIPIDVVLVYLTFLHHYLSFVVVAKQPLYRSLDPAHIQFCLIPFSHYYSLFFALHQILGFLLSESCPAFAISLISLDNGV